MAIIYSYPKVTSPLATDVLVLTDTTLTAGKRKNKTKSLALSDLANYVVSSTSGITGGGTLNTIPIFTGPTTIGDSIITYDSTFDNISINGNTQLFGNVVIGSQLTDITRINSIVTDSTGSLGAPGQVLLANGFGRLVWGTDGGGTVTGTGTTNTLPIWSDGPNGVLGDSPIKLGTGTNSLIYNNLTNIASGINSNAMGNNTEASGIYSTAMGTSTKASGDGSTALGRDAQAIGDYSIAMGDRNITSGNVSSALGFNNSVSGNRSGALGANNIVVGAQTWVVGEGNDVGLAAGNNGDNTIVSGQGNTVKSGTSGVIGKDNTVTNSADEKRNFILGYSNALNEVSDSIAIGGSNTISADRGYAFGESNTTSSSDAYAIGKNNTLRSEDDYAFGLNNTISGSANIAMALGHDNILSGSQSYAFGRDLVDGGEDNTIIIGRYNTQPTTTGRIVFGTGFSNAGRKNAIEIQAGTNAQSGILFPAVRLSTNYNNDQLAAAGGVENGELYRANNQVRININQGTQDARNTEGYNFLTPRVEDFSNNVSKDYSTNYNLEVANWTGSAGNAFLVLPNPPQVGSETGPIANRYIKIITGSTFVGSTLTLSSTAGINGNTTSVLTGAYQSASLWTDGVEWFIL